MRRAWPIPVVALVVLAACDTVATGVSDDVVVVQSFQQIDRSVAPIRLSWSADLSEAFDAANQAIRGARVSITLEGGNEESGIVIPFAEDEPGLYVPTLRHIILPESVYALEAVVPNHGTVTATTRTPGIVEVVAVKRTVVTYQSSEQYELTISIPNTTAERNAFIFLTTSPQPTADLLTPFYQDVFARYQDDIDEFASNAFGIINEDGLIRNDDGTATLKLPWVAVRFYGPNDIFLNAVDDNLYDFYRSQSVQQLGSTLRPGEIAPVIERIENGTGVFGSFSGIVARVIVNRPDT